MSDAFLIALFDLDEHRNRIVKLKIFVEPKNPVCEVDNILSFLSWAICIRLLLSIQYELHSS
ncbi:hypothetical protein APICC_07074 [Apis cerana cerana]|uniref:Uncharacterized protein n=1 Tax=Apis cerana cerana TaxID=94128 RepID=A0A2A3E4S1_APICC|nr:hypothetical protein APICC_07074 [Apis cerana cerana]